MATTVVGLFDDFTHAQGALNDLVNSGFSRESLGIMANDALGQHTGYASQEGFVPDAGETMAKGMTMGAVAGAAGCLILGLASLAIPGVGPAIAAGTILSTLSGAMLGAAAGGMIGALIEVGVPRERAGLYAEGVRRGGTLVTVQTDDARVAEAEAILNRHGVVDIDERVSRWRESGWTEYDPNAEPISREELEREAEARRTARAA